MRHGWQEYRQQPILPASVAYVLLCFNIALAPGALMTTFLVHHGESFGLIVSIDDNIPRLFLMLCAQSIRTNPIPPLLWTGITPSIIGAFGGLSALMGVGATFVSAALVEKLGILKVLCQPSITFRQ